MVKQEACRKGRGVITPSLHELISLDVLRLCDRVLHRSERFTVTDSNIDALLNPNACRAFSKVGIGIYKYFEHAKEPDKQVGEISVDNRSRSICADAAAGATAMARLVIGMTSRTGIRTEALAIPNDQSCDFCLTRTAWARALHWSR